MGCNTCGKAKGIIVGGKVSKNGINLPVINRRAMQSLALSPFGAPKVRMSLIKGR